MLEDHLPKSRYKQPGERVVQGQRMMQAASDIFLGWTKGVEADRYFYWRQLRDMKGSAVVEAMIAGRRSTFYAGICGWTLARAHARSGDPVAIAAYLGDERRVRPVDHRLLRALRRPERAGLPGLREGGPIRTAASGRGRVIADRAGLPFPITGLGSPRTATEDQAGTESPCSQACQAGSSRRT